MNERSESDEKRREEEEKKRKKMMQERGGRGQKRKKLTRKRRNAAGDKRRPTFPMTDFPMTDFPMTDFPMTDFPINDLPPDVLGLIMSFTDMPVMGKSVCRTFKAAGDSRDLAQRTIAIERLLDEGQVSFAEWVLRFCGGCCRGAHRATALAMRAADLGHLDLAILIADEHGAELNEHLPHSAALLGDTEALDRLRRRGCPWDEAPFCAAAAAGDFRVLRWLHRRRCPWGGETYRFAAGEGRGGVIEWLLAKDCPREPDGGDACLAAAGGGHLGALRLLVGAGFAWDKGACAAAAAARGRLGVLRWICNEHGCEPDRHLTLCAARHGRVGVLEWLRDRPARSDRAVHGHISVIEWAQDAGLYPESERCFHGDACWAAVRYDRLDVLKWARGEGHRISPALAACRIGFPTRSTLDWVRANAEAEA